MPAKPPQALSTMAATAWVMGAQTRAQQAASPAPPAVQLWATHAPPFSLYYILIFLFPLPNCAAAGQQHEGPWWGWG